MTFGIIYPDISGQLKFTGLKRYKLGFFFLTCRNEIQCPFSSTGAENTRKTGNFSFLLFPDYRVFPVPANENGIQIRILDRKIHDLKRKKVFFICSYK